MNRDEDFFALLNEQKVKFLIIGAYALAYHGCPRYTGDIDIFISADPNNAAKIVTAIELFGFKNVGITQNDFQKPDIIIQLGYPPLRIDLVTEINGISFTTAWKNREKGFFGRQKVFYISKKDFIRNKKATGRVKDRLDVELLGGKFRK
ncbi:MAG: hypothetical protein HY800_09035 [Ignavibacteriales bacterium]|nr:hypothetical protein [Ignavibacteriales bacterium]